MPKRISDETRIENYFRTAGEMEARGTLRVADAILSVRFPKTQPVTPRRTRGPAKVSAPRHSSESEQAKTATP